MGRNRNRNRGQGVNAGQQQQNSSRVDAVAAPAGVTPPPPAAVTPPLGEPDTAHEKLQADAQTVSREIVAGVDRVVDEAIAKVAGDGVPPDSAWQPDPVDLESVGEALADARADTESVGPGDLDGQHIAVVQLARYGDQAHVLPVLLDLRQRGAEVTVIVHPRFTALFEAVTYVNVVVWDGPDNEPLTAAAAFEGKYDKIIVAQVNGNGAKYPGGKPENFTAAQWVNCGDDYLGRYHELPLVFDNRDHMAEHEALCDELGPQYETDPRPILCYHLAGHSSPFQARHGANDDCAKRFRDWIVAKFSKAYRVVDLGDLDLDKVHHLLGFLERAACLITSDSLPLHLAYAFGTPTFAFSRDHTWYMSEPRAHWLNRWTYAQANEPTVRLEIYNALMDRNGIAYPPKISIRDGDGGMFTSIGREDRDGVTWKRSLARTPGRMIARRIVHVSDWYAPKAGSDDRRRLVDARRTWDTLVMRQGTGWELAIHELKPGQRSSADLGDPRKLPYIKDVIDFGAANAADDDILVFTNADTNLLGDVPNVVRDKLAAGACCYSRRVDVADAVLPYTREVLAQYRAHVGADLFAFSAGWWRAHRDEFPDLLIGCEGWDWIARRVLERHNPDAEINPAVIYHERHSPQWAWSKNIHANPGQQWNRRICEEWARDNGFESALFAPGESQYLFRADPPKEKEPTA